MGWIHDVRGSFVRGTGGHVGTVAALAIAGAGCNAILGNETHDYEPGSSDATTPALDASAGPICDCGCGGRDGAS
ncbi:MAG TPA: hypothetical protein VN894_13120 [Polyangiaceae bacterium]|nr:hypothetical protein [Polyangiaceae bacterium]